MNPPVFYLGQNKKDRLPVRGGRFFFAGETSVSPFMLFWALRFLLWRGRIEIKIVRIY